MTPAQRLYEAEIALHIAHQTGEDAWIAAASNKLHEAVIAFMAAHDRSVSDRQDCTAARIDG